MNRGTRLLIAPLAVLCCAAAAVGLAPAPILPDAMVWSSPPNNAALHASWVLGAEAQPVPYLLRVRLAAGGRIAAHTHPDVRNSTVLAGTLFIGFGDTFDATRVVAVPVGGVYVAPANVAHYVWARDGDVVYQESGTGPTGTTPTGR